MKKNKTFEIALSGICLALAVTFMFGATVVPGIEMTLFVISSLLTIVMIIETGIRGGLLVYAGACILGFILIPGKIAIIPYVFFFGYYGILKYFIEKAKSGAVQISLKLIFFAALLCLGLLVFKSILAEAVSLPEYPSAVLIAGGTLMLLLYDYIVTFLIRFYMRRIHSRLKR